MLASGAGLGNTPAKPARRAKGERWIHVDEVMLASFHGS